MTMTIEEIMRLGPVIPVLTIERAADAVPLARALLAGGIRVIEITLRTSAALDAARAVRDQVPETVVGIGTIVEPDDIARARQAGARFGVSPGLTAPLAEAAKATGLPFLPGAVTASELMAARALGFRHLKFFPAEPSGGVAALKALAGPFPDIRFCPTGGIDETALPAYLALANVLCVGGSWLAPAADLAAGRWEAIATRAHRATAPPR